MKLFVAIVVVMLSVAVVLCHPRPDGERSIEISGNDAAFARVKRQQRNGQVSVGVERSRQGTDVSAQVQRNLWRSNNGRSTLDGNAHVQQHFGGPAGRQRPNYGAGVQFTHRF